MPPSSRNFFSIYKKHEAINKASGIQAAEEPLFEERLVLVFTAPKVQQRTPGGLKNHKILLQSRQKKARGIYLQVLRNTPDIFIAFILTVSPRMCVVFNAPAFFDQHNRHPVSLSETFRSFTWEIAKKHALQSCPDFRSWMRSISDLSPPSTEAHGKNSCLLELGDLRAIRLAFGDTISDAIEKCHTHRRTLSNSLSMTEWVWTNIPYNAHQDAIVHINVGSALKLAETLFPCASYKIEFLLSESTTASDLGRSEAPCGPEMPPNLESPNLDFAYFTLRGASVPGVKSIFSAAISEGIEESQLRTWERENLLSDSTDCISMKIPRAQPQYGVIQLRVGSRAGFNLANTLYQITSTIPAS